MKKEITQCDNEVIIHQDIARLRGRLTTIQSKSMLSILKRANEQVEANPNILNFTIPTDMFLADIQNKDTAGLATVVQKVSKHLETLMVQIFEWGTAQSISKAIFMQQVEVTEQQVTFKFSDYIREHIKPISNALIVKDFELIQSFRSEYARQLYKHIMMWEDKQTLYLSLKDLKDFLGVPDTKSYQRMSNLKVKILNVAVDEINEKCPWMDLRYTNVTKPRSRAIEGFNFAWFKKTKEVKEQQKLKDTELDQELKKYIGRVFYKEGYNWKIISISKGTSTYTVYCKDIEDSSYTKTFDISKSQLDAAK